MSAAVAGTEPRAAQQPGVPASADAPPQTARATAPGAGSAWGGGGGGPARGIEYEAYFNFVIGRIRSNWVWAGEQTDNLAVTLRFSIQPDGRIVNVRKVRGSTNYHFDQSAIAAVKAVRDLGPPPDSNRRDFADVELVFRPQDLAR